MLSFQITPSYSCQTIFPRIRIFGILGSGRLKNKITRKEFLKGIRWILVVPFLLPVAMALKRHKGISNRNQIRIPDGITEGVTFAGEIILIKKDQRVNLFSSRCPHLGCQINKVENEVLICPCHGSTFNLKGIALSGPANSSLKELPYDFDNSTGEMIVKI